MTDFRYRDTVNSVGLIPKRLPFTTSNTIVRTFRHAVALDERRAKFKANLWNRPKDDEVILGIEGQKPIFDHVSDHSHKAQKPDHKKKGSLFDKNPSLRKMEHQYSGKVAKETDVEEVLIDSSIIIFATEPS
jgi:uncharacterized protein (DUF2235 family)